VWDPTTSAASLQSRRLFGRVMTIGGATIGKLVFGETARRHVEEGSERGRSGARTKMSKNASASVRYCTRDAQIEVHIVASARCKCMKPLIYLGGSSA